LATSGLKGADRGVFKIIAVNRYWEIIAGNLEEGGWSLGYVSSIDSEGRTIWIADAHRGEGKRFTVRAMRY